MDQGELSPEQARGLLDYWERLNSVLRLEPEAATIPPDIAVLLKQRTNARAAKDWAKSDTLRDELLKHGWVVNDSKEGPKLTRTGA